MRPIHEENFGHNVRLAMWGRGNDGQNYSAVTGDYLAGVRAAEGHFGAPVNVLRVFFKNDGFVNFGALDTYKDAEGKPQYEYVGERGSVRMHYQGDVGYMPVDPKNPRTVVIALLNADCPAIFSLDYNDEGQVVGIWFAHAGLDCLVPKAVNDPANGTSVLDTIMKERERVPHGTRMEFFFGGGACACCYGLDDVSEVKARLEARYGARIAHHVTRAHPSSGPRMTNKVTGESNSSIDLAVVFRAEFDRIYFSTSDVVQLLAQVISDVCTTCLDLDGNRALWSNMWDPKEAGGNPRNFTCFSWTP